MKHVLFVCVQNAGRSQMAAAFTQKDSKDRITATSGGTHPADKVHKIVVKAMQEKSIDLSQNQPRRITVAELHGADQVVVMGCGAEEFCPAPLLNHVTDWELDNPKGEPIEKVREIRDEIEEKVKQLIETLTSPANE